MMYFTNNPLERDMVKRSRGRQGREKSPAPPVGHRCYGCGNYGSGCVWPCFREIIKEEAMEHEISHR
jgi:hypothetical protein